MVNHYLTLALILFQTGLCQINLGQFNLQPGPNGIWDLGFNQGGSLLGFGGERGFNAQIGKGVLGFTGNQGVVVANERIGTNSQFGLNQGGLNLGSNLNFGNNANNQGGDLNSFIQGIGNFFKNLSPSSVGTPMGMQSGVSDTTPMPFNQGTDSIGAMDGDVVHESSDKGEEITVNGGESLLMMNSKDDDIDKRNVPSISVDSASEGTITDDSSLLH